MSGVARKLLGGVLAISLFVCSSLLAFAVTDFQNTLPYYTDFYCNVYGTRVYTSDEYRVYQGGDAYIADYPSPSGALTTSSFVMPSSAPASMPYIRFGIRSENKILRWPDTNDIVFYYYSRPIPEGYYFSSVLFYSNEPLNASVSSSTVRLVDLGTADMRLDHRIIVNEIPNVSSQYKYAYEVQFIYYVPFTDSVNYELTFDLYFEEPLNSSSVSEVIFRSGITSGVYSPLDDNSLFALIERGFDSIYSFLFTRKDEQESDYIAVTDPSTSVEIQEAQGMLDTVEDFESQLYGNITTEFDKIDFTTPTNLAAPVAYVGDKITRSMNSLGNYQPLVFVPLVLGIMLIMLGRGVSALGSFGSAAARAPRTDGLDPIRNNPRDERWLY